MTSNEKVIANYIFKNRVLTSEGQKYEDFFGEIMEKYNSDFKLVKAHGNIGDKKNDGFDKTTGTYYQVYGPEDSQKESTIHTAVKKLEEDFRKLYTNWNDKCKINKYYFVINDKFKGVAAPIHEKVIELEKEFTDVEIDVFTARDLQKVFNKLDLDDVQDVIGVIPTEVDGLISMECMHKTVEHLLNSELTSEYAGKLYVPEFYDKIEFNNLSKVTEIKLITGSYQENVLKDYFDENPGVDDVLQKKFNELYECAKMEIDNTEDDASERRFYYILNKASYKNTALYQSCVLVLMAYYFSTCDIFEEPQ